MSIVLQTTSFDLPVTRISWRHDDDPPENFKPPDFVAPVSVCNLNTKEHKSKSAAITQTGNRVQDLAGVRNETKSSESKFGKAQVSIC